MIRGVGKQSKSVLAVIDLSICYKKLIFFGVKKTITQK